MLKHVFKRKAVDYSTVRKSRTVPNQALRVGEIVRRFVRGLPVSVKVADGRYYDDNDQYDLEKLAMLDPVERAYIATRFRAEAERLKAEAKENERAIAEAREAAAEEKAQSDARVAPGIDNLDNTMPDDTDTGNQRVTRSGSKKSKS